MLNERRSGVTKAALAALALCAYFACEEEEVRPGIAGDCDENCVENPGPILNPGPDAPGMGGSAGAGGTGGGAGTAGSAAVLSGSVRAIIAPVLTDDPDLDGTVVVRAPGTSMAQVSVNSGTDGSFRLEGVTPNANLWVGVGPFSNDQASTFVDTLQVVNTTVAAPVALLAMRRVVLEQIKEGFLSNPLEFNADRGHVILRFVNQQRQGISGISLVSPDPAQTSVAYDQGDTYSDVPTETAERGTLVLMNLPTSPYPGTATTIRAEVGGMNRDVDVHTAAGAVTLVTQVMP
jgi:hypothetical protein